MFSLRENVHTICSLTVLPSSSIVRIFYPRQLALLPVSASLTYEIDSDGRNVGLGVCVIGESQQQAGLSDAGVSNEQELEEVIVSERRCQYSWSDAPSASSQGTLD